MFYCEKCRVDNNWPKSFRVKSLGRCEECGEQADCHDSPHMCLQDPLYALSLENNLRKDNKGHILDAIRNDDPNLEQIIEETMKISAEALKKVTEKGRWRNAD